MSQQFSSHRFCIAPMLDWTDKHARYFMRLLSQHARLYTEMVTTGAILNGDPERFLAFNGEETPLALQLGGSNPNDLGKACKIAENYTYDEINLNIGCPSDRVQSGMFGACLMAQPALVAECINAMQNSSSKLITVKCRIGIDKTDSLEFLQAFIEPIAATGCNTFIIHARSAWLEGLSPKENRDIPPLNYERVYTIKKLYPQLNIVINGGINHLDDCKTHLQHTDGVMVGREAYNNPYFLADIDQQLFQSNKTPLSRFDILESMLPYIERQLIAGVKLNHISRHILGLFNGLDGAKAFRRYISQEAHKKNAGIEVLQHAASLIQQTDTNDLTRTS
jgi:tRNA-dihydrouridine synthase A